MPADTVSWCAVSTEQQVEPTSGRTDDYRCTVTLSGEEDFLPVLDTESEPISSA
jgi:hypothetical protein